MPAGWPASSAGDPTQAASNLWHLRAWKERQGVWIATGIGQAPLGPARHSDDEQAPTVSVLSVLTRAHADANARAKAHVCSRVRICERHADAAGRVRYLRWSAILAGLTVGRCVHGRLPSCAEAAL